MNIVIKVVKENKDGSANAMVDFDKEGLEFLVQEGLLSIMQQHIEQNKNAQEGIKLREKLEAAKGTADKLWSSTTKNTKPRAFVTTEEVNLRKKLEAMSIKPKGKKK